MLDTTYIKVHADGCGAVGGNQAIGRTKKGLNTKLHRAIDKKGKPVRVILSAGQEVDCAYAGELIAGVPLRVLFADRGYDVNEIVDAARAGGVEVVIPPKRNRKEARS